MNVSLTPELDEYVAAQVASGRYRSVSEFIRECIRVKIDQDEERELKLAALRRDVAEGMGALETGDWVDGRSALEQARRRIAERERD